MLLAAVVLGALALYYFGLRAGAWVAVATLVLCIVALVAPRWATAIYAFVAAGAIALWRVGSRRQRPPDAVIAVRLIRRAVGRAWSTARTLLGGGDRDKK
ncbi:MAG: hypothetical protein JWM53_2595 [bacterium]|nr:hypothetical protein [bacterium]